jgi:hypothetical protein
MSEQATSKEQRSIVPIGPNGLEFRDMDSLFRFASAVELSGLAPKGFDKKEAIFIALCMALELRMSPMAALQNIAVINGRPGIYGDAALALVRASGLCDSYSQELVGDGDQRKAVVRSARKGVEIISEFGVQDAKRAGLWGKAGPWSQYPDRMLIFRARGFNLRDNFGDVLKGFRTTEELHDWPDEKPAKAFEIKRPEIVRTSAPAAPANTVTAAPATDYALLVKQALSATPYIEADLMTVLHDNVLALRADKIDEAPIEDLRRALDNWKAVVAGMEENAKQ